MFHPNCTHSTVAVANYDIKHSYDDEGRPLNGYNSADKPNPPADDKEANREYRSYQVKNSARKAVSWQYQKKIDKYWADGMSEEQRQDLLDYTESDKFKLNKAMRAGTVTIEQRKKIINIDEVLVDYPKFKGDVYRAITFATEAERDAFYKGIRNANTKEELLSTSLNPTVPNKYIYKVSKSFENPKVRYPVYITYKNTSKGSYLSDKSKVPSDKEVLFPTGTKFKLLDKEEKDGILYLTMKERS